MMVPRPGMNASSKESYELLEFTVDGRPQTIRRATRKSGQTYTVHLDAKSRTGEAVRLRQIFRTITPCWGHRLFFELPQPARNMALSLDYTNTDITHMRVSDTVASARPVHVVRSPQEVADKVVKVSADGWLMPKSGFAFTWTLEKELPRDQSREAA